MAKNKPAIKPWLLIAGIAMLIAIIAGVLLVTNVFGGQNEIRLDNSKVYFEFGKKINLPDTTVYSSSGKEIAYDSVCIGMVAPDGSEVDISSGYVTPMMEGTYVLTYASVSQKTKTEIQVECTDTIFPTLNVEVPAAYLIKEKYEDTDFTVFTLPIISADDLAGIDSDKTEVKITNNGIDVPLNGDQFVLTEEGDLTFTFTVYDLNGLSTTVTKESIAEAPEYFDTYCLSTFAKDTYLTKVCGGWLNSYYEATILESDTDPSGKTMEGVLKITYDASDREAGACIHLAKPVLREDIEYLSVTLRLENASVTADVIDAVFYKSGYKEGFWTISNVSTTVGSSYKTIYIGKSVLDTMVEGDGYIRELQIETFGDEVNARSLYIADVSYGPKGSKMPENSNTTSGTNDGGGNSGTIGNLKDDFPQYCLSTFAKDAYKNHMCGGWVHSKYSTEILGSDTDSNGKTMEGVLKITYPASDKEASACIHLGRVVKRSDVKSIEVTLRVENGFTTAGGTVDTVFFQSNYKEGYWTTSNVPAYAGKNYVTISIGDNVLNKMMDSDGYIRQFQIETFGDGKTARSIYIADISYTPVEGKTPDEPGESEKPEIPELTGNCLSAFDDKAYELLLCGGWLNSKHQVDALDSDTDSSGKTMQGVLKITYPALDEEASACIHLGKEVKLADVKSLDITLRLENGRVIDNGTINTVFYKAGHKEGYWTVANRSALVGKNYVTISITGNALNRMADADGFIRQFQIETFGDGQTVCSLYLADISYTPVDNEPEEPLPEDALTINGLGAAQVNILYFKINVETGVKDWTVIANLCNEETHILINDKAWSTQELGAVSGKSFYINNIGATLGTKITIKEGFTATFQGVTYKTYQDYNYWWNGTTWTTEEVERPDDPTDPTEPTPENNVVISGVAGQNPNQLMMSLPTDPNVKIGTKMTVQSGFTVTIDGVDYGTVQNYDFWWNGSAWTTEEVQPDQTLVITSLGAAQANIIYFNINAETGVKDWTNISNKCNEETHILINDRPWSNQELGGIAGKSFYINNIGADIGTKITIEQGFTARFNDTNYVTDKAYNYWWNGTTWTTEEVEKPEPEVTEPEVTEPEVTEPEVTEPPELPENCLSAFDSAAYIQMLCGGWLNSKYEATILESDTDAAGRTENGVLKITYPASDREASACVHLAEAVHRDSIESLDITLRLENGKTIDAGKTDVVFYKADFYDGYWSVANKSTLVGQKYVTISITGNALNRMTDGDGYIRKLQIETFGDRITSRSLYLADISYTPASQTPDPDNTLVISGTGNSTANTVYFKINTATGLSDWTNIASKCNEETHILINDQAWSTQEIGAVSGQYFYVNKIGGVVGTKITVKKGFSVVFNGVPYVANQDYHFWWNGSKWITEEVPTTGE